MLSLGMLILVYSNLLSLWCTSNSLFAWQWQKVAWLWMMLLELKKLMRIFYLSYSIHWIIFLSRNNCFGYEIWCLSLIIFFEIICTFKNYIMHKNVLRLTQHWIYLCDFEIIYEMNEYNWWCNIRCLNNLMRSGG